MVVMELCKLSEIRKLDDKNEKQTFPVKYHSWFEKVI
jgi:hypothetical protein